MVKDIGKKIALAALVGGAALLYNNCTNPAKHDIDSRTILTSSYESAKKACAEDPSCADPYDKIRKYDFFNKGKLDRIENAMCTNGVLDRNRYDINAWLKSIRGEHLDKGYK